MPRRSKRQRRRDRNGHTPFNLLRVRKHNARATGRFHWQDVCRRYSEQHARCYYCRALFQHIELGRPHGITTAWFHIEHRNPICRGGSNWPENIVLACKACNERKGVMTEAEFRRETAKDSPSVVIRRRDGEEKRVSTLRS